MAFRSLTFFALGVLHFSRDIQGHRDHYESEYPSVRSDEHSEFLHWEQSVLLVPPAQSGVDTGRIIGSCDHYK